MRGRTPAVGHLDRKLIQLTQKIHCLARGKKKKKSHHLDLTKQIGKSLLLDNY